MATADNSIRVPLRLLAGPRTARNRRGEPVTFGVPLPRGAAASCDDLWLEHDHGNVRPAQVAALDRWPDGSIRWALLDFAADVVDGVLQPICLRVGTNARASAAGGLEVTEGAHGVSIRTATAEFAVRMGGAFPFSEVIAGGHAALEPAASGFFVTCQGARTRFVVETARVTARGPRRAEIAVRAVPATPLSIPLEVFGRVHVFADSATARVEITIRNPRAARHPGGIWELGDPGSALLDAASLVLQLPANVERAEARAEPDSSWTTAGLPFEIYQDSSGGAFWNHRTHVNRDGVVRQQFSGYRVRSGADERHGVRAAPVVRVRSGPVTMTAAVPEFWQNCPRAMSVNGRAVDISFFPSQFADAHELQGGEQKTHTAVLAFGDDPVCDSPLAWVHEPLRVHVPPEWSCGTGAVPYLALPADDDRGYAELVSLALDSEHGFFAKQERFDEFGWRHFGDLPGDHESAFQPSDRPFVSHYNNQYDAVAAGAMHFLRTGDPLWWRLMDELARHVRDIDIYHTREDRAAYNGGLFWHTQHYVDAGRSTHRTYPSGSGGGGPSGEHNYALGLMLHYFLTGEAESRDAAIGLGRWVVEMDDGRRTPFRWLAGGHTGLASATGSADYHGPGRGPANSILACLVARRLSGDPEFEAKADELIRRCIHPNDDLARRNLLDVERRWYYTVFLQALGVYLHDKMERGENDEMYAYARASLLHYARWMAEHEVPYLTRPEVLQYPTETWAAQDLRKAEVFWWAALHATPQERERFVERARYFFRESIATLGAAPTRHFTRPLVLALRNGAHVGWFEAHPDAAAPPAVHAVHSEVPPPFVPQKIRALRRARRIAAGAVLAIVGLGAFAAVSWF